MPRLAVRILTAVALFGTVLHNARLRRATAAFFAFSAVDFGQWTAILVYAYGATGPASVGLVGLMELLPAAVAAPLASTLGDRYPRERVLLISYLVQAISLGVTGCSIILGGPPPVVYGLSIVGQAVLTTTRPLHNALLPSLADSIEELTASNALASMSEGIGALVGPALAGALLALASVGAAFIASSAALLLAAVLVVHLRRHAEAVAPGEPAEGMSAAAPPRAVPRGSVARAPSERDPSKRDPSPREPLARDRSALDGLRLAATDPDLRVVMGLLAARMLVYGGLEVLLVLIALGLLGLGESGPGFLLAALGVGTIAGGASTVGLAGRRHLSYGLGIGAVVVGLPVLLIGAMPSVASALVLLALAGVGMALLDVAGHILLQRIAADEVRAGVFGMLEGLLLVGESLGSLLVVPVTAVVGVRGSLVALGLALPAAALVAAARFARIDRRVVIPEREIAALRAVSIFAPVPAPALEAVARHLVLLSVPAGTVVIREGEEGDRFYVVEAGRLSVAGGGSVLATFGRGDHFGEIALLRDVPRTATVTAETDVELFAIEREPFLAAITGDPSLMLATERVAARRLADRLAIEAPAEG